MIGPIHRHTPPISERWTNYRCIAERHVTPWPRLAYFFFVLFCSVQIPPCPHHFHYFPFRPLWWQKRISFSPTCERDTWCCRLRRLFSFLLLLSSQVWTLVPPWRAMDVHCALFSGPFFRHFDHLFYLYFVIFFALIGSFIFVCGDSGDLLFPVISLPVTWVDGWNEHRVSLLFGCCCLL